jgi:phosphatidylglycerophosphatase C
VTAADMPLSATARVPRLAAVPKPVVAAFDVDGTVTVRDCVVPFLRRVGGAVPVAARLGLRPDRVVTALARRDRDRLKALAARVTFTRRAIADVEAAGREFADAVAAWWLRADTVARIRWHQREQHSVVFVSASFGAYLRPLGERLGVDGVVCTELVVDGSGRCTGELVDGNCRGPEKVRRLHGWLDEHRGGRDAVHLWAYGDSPGDRELLADADRPVWTHEQLAAEPGPDG